MKSVPLDVFECPLQGVNLIEASAGTGKTWTICGLYLRLLLERELTVQQILVVTFTTAATAELRERIRTRIVDMAEYLAREPGSTDDVFLSTLASAVIKALRVRGKGVGEQRGGEQGVGNQKVGEQGVGEQGAGEQGVGEQGVGNQNAGEHGTGKPSVIDKQALIERLHLALQTFDEASIFTIHGFCQRALADNPFSAGLPMSSELVENDHDLLMEAVHDFWRRHIAAASVSPAFARYLHSRKDTPEKYAKLLQRHLAKPLARHLWPADIDDPLIDAAALNAAYQRARATWQSGRDAIVEHLAASIITSLYRTSYTEAWVRTGGAQWDEICGGDDALAEPGHKTHLYRASVLKNKTKKKCITPGHAFFDEAEDYLVLREQIEASLSLARARLLRRLFHEAGSQLRELKRSRQVISFDDMLSNVHERLKNPEFPWLAASIEGRFPAALIDEFQDTDPLQFEIFRTIYDGSDSTVFLVGDPKQAIYSFRHADLHTYLRAKPWAAKEWSLSANQRSSEPLLRALNGLFGANPNAFILPGIDYRPVGYGSKPRPAFADGSSTRAPLTVWQLPEGSGLLSKTAAKSAAVQATCMEIARLIAAGSRGEITIGGRALRPRDIAVLVRTRALGAEVKLALVSLRVGAVEMSRSGVFRTADAEDLETVLTGILSPAREPLVRAALATNLFGCDVGDIEALSGSEALLMSRIREFTDYRELWFEQGFGVMYRRLLADQAVAGRMLARPDGERRLTNFLHLGESLQQAEETHGAPEALLRHLKTLRDDENFTDAAQLRLESDQNLVQIMTIHTCKGLEFPVVFCPFICDGGTKVRGSGPEGLEYHDAELKPVIDFREHDESTKEFADIKLALSSEQAAETVRLLYVALTRAVHRCYLVAGSYESRRSTKESGRSMLNWLAAGQGMSLESWFKTERTAAEIGAAWRRFAQVNAGAELSPLPKGAGTPIDGVSTDAATLSTPAASIVVSGGWRMSSYSGLTYGARSEQAAGDHDARVLPAPDVPIFAAAGDAAAGDAAAGDAAAGDAAAGDVVAAIAPAAEAASGAVAPGLAEHDILRFPRGPSAGECVHAVFEGIDFTNPADWEDAIVTALIDHPQTLVGYSGDAQQKCLTAMLMKLVEDVTSATLIPGLQLRSIPLARRLTELEFTFPVPYLSLSELNDALKSLGYDMPALQVGTLEGYLKGFIDLVFEHEGQFFLLDWKSNHLGFAAADYARGPLARAMSEHAYHLQYLLYTVALDRYLRLRLQNYRYETHVGGVLYLFVRGVRPHWTRADGSTPGVYFHRPTAEAVRRLNQLLDSSLEGAAA